MAAQAWQIYNQFKATLGLKVLELNTDTIKMALFLSTSNCANVALSPAQYATLTNELANGDGYTTGGFAPSGVSYSQAAGTATFTFGTSDWTASGGNLVFRYAVIYDSSAPNKDLICFSLLDTTPADTTVLNGATLSTFAPVVSITAINITVPTGTLTFATFAPTVSITFPPPPPACQPAPTPGYTPGLESTQEPPELTGS